MPLEFIKVDPNTLKVNRSIDTAWIAETVDYLTQMEIGDVGQLEFKSEPERKALVTLLHVAADQATVEVAIRRATNQPYVVFSRKS